MREWPPVKRARGERRMHRARLAIVTAISLLVPAAVDAQDTALVDDVRLRPLQAIAEDLHRPLADLEWRHRSRMSSGHEIVMPAMFGQTGGQSTSARQRSLTRTILGAIVGATGGFFAGGFTGAWIEGDRCHCDDPGLKGFLIGAPVGAVAGGIVGGLYLF
jgi:hypothetical protein